MNVHKSSKPIQKLSTFISVEKPKQTMSGYKNVSVNVPAWEDNKNIAGKIFKYEYIAFLFLLNKLQ